MNNVTQIYKEISELLDLGMFPGSVSAHIMGARIFLQNLIKELEANEGSSKETVESGGRGVRDEKDTTGLADSAVHDKRRKSSRRKSK